MSKVKSIKILIKIIKNSTVKEIWNIWKLKYAKVVLNNLTLCIRVFQFNCVL